MQTLHPADRVIRPDRVEVPAELEAEIRGIEVGRPRGRGLWWAVAALVVAVLASVLWPAATGEVAEIHDSWMNVPVAVSAAEIPTLTRITSPIPTRIYAYEIHDSWMTAPVGIMPMGFEIHDSWVTVTP